MSEEKEREEEIIFDRGKEGNSVIECEEIECKEGEEERRKRMKEGEEEREGGERREWEEG